MQNIGIIKFDNSKALVAFAIQYLQNLGVKPEYFSEKDKNYILNRINEYRKLLDHNDKVLNKTLPNFFHVIDWKLE